MVEVSVRVTPRAKQNRVRMVDAREIRVDVTAPPAEGEANQAVIELLAKSLGIAKSRIEIVRGASSRQKELQIDMDETVFREKVEAWR